MKKLLIWDGDETLWSGTLLEGGTPTLPPGRLALCQALCERGVLQAVASFNRPEDVQRALHVLELETFFLHNRCAIVGDLRKSQMVREIVAAYDLSRFSDVVFVDDLAFNRSEVVAAFPDVLAVDPSELPRVVDEHFTKAQYTDEDRLRVRRYQSEEVRRVSSAAYGQDYQAFLRDCKLTLSMKRMSDGEIPRVLDLIARANRMAALARSFSKEELQAPDVTVWVGYVGDRFGEYGLSAVLIETSMTGVVGLVVSCRLQGRGIGSAFLGTWLARRGVERETSAIWRETEYNQGMRSLFEWFEFSLEVRESGVLARRAPHLSLRLPEWVRVEVDG